MAPLFRSRGDKGNNADQQVIKRLEPQRLEPQRLEPQGMNVVIPPKCYRSAIEVTISFNGWLN